jgi:YVTN family beta-propeller protein
VWVTDPDDGQITRVDAGNGSTNTIHVGGLPSAIAVSPGVVWVTDETGPSLLQINPQSNSLVGNPLRVGSGPDGVAVGFGSVWVANRLDGSVTRLDENNPDHGTTIRVGVAPAAITVDPRLGVWVADAGADRVLQIDPKSNSLSQSIPVGSDPEAIAIDGGNVWVANAQNGTVSRVDPSTGSVAATIPVGQEPTSISVTGGGVWVSNRFGGTLSRVDASGTSPTTTIATGSAPVGSTVVGDQLWVSVQGALASHRGGTLRVVMCGLPVAACRSENTTVPTPDPLDFYGITWQILIMTNDGLVAFKRVGGGAGTTVVPDLATAIPEPTAGGLVYTFHLRPGIRYSTGATVEPGDIRRTIERGFQVDAGGAPANSGFYDDIVGAKECERAFVADPGRSTCDLSRGIVTDVGAGTIQFHLTRPDPDFLQKLALPFAFAEPPGVPMSRMATKPLPATGPYRLATYDPDHGLTLVRNARFHAWSQAAQPDGFPDEIRYTFGVSPEDEVKDVENGTADWMVDSPPPDSMATLTTRYAGRVHPFLEAATYYVALGTTTRPFDDPLVRKAVNYAFDRAATLRIIGGPDAGRITCQLLPPNFPGYRPYCPYTVDANDQAGTWTGPDLPKAQALVRRSGTEGDRVEVWFNRFVPHASELTAYVVGLLRSLGYDALRSPEQSKYFSQAYPPGPGVQVALDGYLQDYASANDFLQQFDCRSQLSLTRMCDPQVTTAIDRATEAQTSSPEQADPLWTDADHLVVDRSPLIDYDNPIGIDFLSSRVGNNQHSLQWGLLLDQLWVR